MPAADCAAICAPPPPWARQPEGAPHPALFAESRPAARAPFRAVPTPRRAPGAVKSASPEQELPGRTRCRRRRRFLRRRRRRRRAASTGGVCVRVQPATVALRATALGLAQRDADAAGAVSAPRLGRMNVRPPPIHMQTQAASVGQRLTVRPSYE